MSNLLFLEESTFLSSKNEEKFQNKDKSLLNSDDSSLVGEQYI